LDGVILLQSGEGVRPLSDAIVNKPTKAIDARVTGGLDTDYELCRVISKRPGHSIYKLAKEIGWSSGKVCGSVQRLESEGLVNIKKDIRGGRSILKVQAAKGKRHFARALFG
jgi:hypothetical protein